MTMAVRPHTLVVIWALLLYTGLGIHLNDVMDHTTSTYFHISYCDSYKNRTYVDCSVGEFSFIQDIPATVFSYDISSNQIQTVEPFAFGRLQNLTTLDLEENHIQTLVNNSFASIPKLDHVNLRYNMIQSIADGAFTGTESISKIDLSWNLLSEVPSVGFQPRLRNIDLSYNRIVNATFPSTYRDMNNNLSVYLSGNQIQTLDKFTFSSLAGKTIVNMYLSENNISHVGPDTFDSLTSIENLYLSDNPLTTQALKNIVDSCSRKQVKYLDLSGVFRTKELLIKGTSAFMNLGIRLGMCGIFCSDFPEKVVNYVYSALTKPNKGPPFQLSKLGYSDRDFDGTLSMEEAESNNFSSFLKYLPTSLESIFLKENKLKALNHNELKYYKSLQQLIPLKNKMFGKCLDLYAFFGLFCLGNTSEEFRNSTIIRLSVDELFQFSIIDFPEKKNVLNMDLAENNISSFPKHLPTSLESLNLENNKIEYLYQNDMSYLSELIKLNLARNHIVHVMNPGAFNGLGKLQVLDLAENKINRLPFYMFKPLHNLTHLYLGKNRITYFYLQAHQEPLVSLRVLDLSDNGFESIEKPFSYSFPFLNSLHLEGNNLGKTGFLSRSGELLFSGLTELEQVNISNNNICNLPGLIFRDQVSLKVLNISMNKISGLDSNMFQFARKIAKLDISFNLLYVLTESNLHGLKNLKEMNLKDNLFICNCEFLWFREWVSSTDVALPDKESYACHGPEEWRGKRVLEFTKDKINCSFFSMNTIVWSDVITIFLFAVLVISVYRMRWRLLLRLYMMSKNGRHFLRHFRRYAQHPDYVAINDDDREAYYDAYISYSDRDYDWALLHLLPGIDIGQHEDVMFEGNFKLFFHPRDKKPGFSVIANIFEHMSGSRKVIVVLSQDYIDDGMNIFKLDLATTLYHNQEIDDIIVIKVGNVPARRIPAHLYTQMRSGRFIEWENDPNSIERFKAKLKDRLRGDRVDLC